MAFDEITTSFPPPERATSPEPWISPSLALNAVPRLDRSVSTASSVSSMSGQSASSRLSDGGKRRGYMRPEGTQFSRSARSRESVMNLGTIAHLQYYFARTGLLDAATGRVAKSRKTLSRTVSGSERRTSGLDSDFSFPSLGEDFVESPMDEGAAMSWEDQEPVMLPPTVSTYKANPVYVPPPPDMTILRRELRESLEETLKHVLELEKTFVEVATKDKNEGAALAVPPSDDHDQKSFEAQGLSLIDVATLAIRAAKNYFTAHADTQRLYAIKSERQIRRELYEALDVLKRLAMRNFANGVQSYETTSMKEWIASVEALLDTEEEQERLEQEERESWTWREGDWTGKERERELLFLRSFDASPEALPPWTDVEDGQGPTPFLETLRNGLRLVHLHNALVKKSRRHFEEIKQFHTDTAKPYRCAENLRFWAKAAELRWDIKLDIDVMGVVNGTSSDGAAWKKFDRAVLKWARGVREEIMAEWKEQALKAKTPTLQIEPMFEAL